MKNGILLILLAFGSSWLMADPARTLIVRLPSATLGIDVDRPNISEDCTTQRDLDPQGIQHSQDLQATLAGFVNGQTPIYHSEYCRSQKAAELIFPDQPKQTLTALNDACFNNQLQNLEHQNQLMALIANAEKTQVLISHNCNIRMLLGSALATQCNGLRRLEPGQWLFIRPTVSGLSIEQCPQ